MRFLFADAARARRLAKLLKNRLAEHGVDWPLHACRDAVAEATGYPSFHEIETSAGRAGASPVDAECPPAVVSARRELQRSALAERGLPPELVATVLDAVPFTGAFGGAPGPLAPPGPTPRQRRIEASRTHIGAMRAGNFDASTLVDAGGTFLGFALGHDHSLVHDEPPDGFLETFGVTDAPVTLGEALIPVPAPDRIAFSDPGDGCATTLHLNPDPRDPVVRAPFSPAPFLDATGRAPWRYEGSNGRTPDLVTAWSHARISLAAFGEEARERVRDLHRALLAGDVLVVHGRSTGPLLVLADRVELDASPYDLVRSAWAARRTLTGDVEKGSHLARLDAIAHRPGPFVA